MVALRATPQAVSPSPRGGPLVTLRCDPAAAPRSCPAGRRLVYPSARTDFAAIKSDLQFVMGQLAVLPTRKELARIALGIIFGAAGLVIEAFPR